MSNYSSAACFFSKDREYTVPAGLTRFMCFSCVREQDYKEGSTSNVFNFYHKFNYLLCHVNLQSLHAWLKGLLIHKVTGKEGKKTQNYSPH